MHGDSSVTLQPANCIEKPISVTLQTWNTDRKPALNRRRKKKRRRVKALVLLKTEIQICINQWKCVCFHWLGQNLSCLWMSQRSFSWMTQMKCHGWPSCSTAHLSAHLWWCVLHAGQVRPKAKPHTTWVDRKMLMIEQLNVLCSSSAVTMEMKQVSGLSDPSWLNNYRKSKLWR